MFKKGTHKTKRHLNRLKWIKHLFKSNSIKLPVHFTFRFKTSIYNGEFSLLTFNIITANTYQPFINFHNSITHFRDEESQVQRGLRNTYSIILSMLI